eukprot:266861_1
MPLFHCRRALYTACCRKPFNASLDVNKVKLYVGNTLNFRSDNALANNFIELFNTYGFVILECDNMASTESTEQFLENNEMHLSYLFGTISEYEKADDRGFVTINSLSPTSYHVASAQKMHIPHTDGAYCNIPEKIVTLGCVHPCKSGGGQSILVSGQNIYEYINELCELNVNFRDGFERLFDNDCITIGRKLLNSDQWVEVTKPIFKWNNHFDVTKPMIEICYRNDNQLIRMNYNNNLNKLWEKVKLFVHNEENQLLYQLAKHEILVVDNYSVMHGRTVFEENELRIMKRMNFKNDDKGILFDCLLHGIHVQNKI